MALIFEISILEIFPLYLPSIAAVDKSSSLFPDIYIFGIFTAFKKKSFAFKVLEGLIKESADAPDMEEAQEGGQNE